MKTMLRALRWLAAPRWLWWLFTPWYRRLGTPGRAEKYISSVADRRGITRQQAIAMIYAEIPPPLRPALDPYRADLDG